MLLGSPHASQPSSDSAPWDAWETWDSSRKGSDKGSGGRIRTLTSGTGQFVQARAHPVRIPGRTRTCDRPLRRCFGLCIVASRSPCRPITSQIDERAPRDGIRLPLLPPPPPEAARAHDHPESDPLPCIEPSTIIWSGGWAVKEAVRAGGAGHGRVRRTYRRGYDERWVQHRIRPSGCPHLA